VLPLKELTKETIMSEEVFDEIFSQKDEIQKARLIASLADRAAELKVRKNFENLVRVYTNAEKKRAGNGISLVENWTNFTGGKYDRMKCRNWIAADDGIYMGNSNTSTMDILACYHPILPIERLKNLETGEEQIKLAYKRNNYWSEILVPKTMVTSANKVVALSGRGIAVTSENARHLVRYLSDVENSNEESIGVQYSSSKLGWVGDGFLPYDKDIVFDGDIRFGQLFESISAKGDRAAWYSHVKELRRSGRMEIKFMMAASFASVLLYLLGGLPFFVDLWGETEGGKTVMLMLAASIWANPDESRYIGDFKTTDVALEARADMLNNLPMILDDTSKTSNRIRDNFEGFIYDLCSGKGKSRSNKDLGINRENRWRNCILTNGERPLSGYVCQGGAINRIIEVECGDKLFKNPQYTVEMVKKNYGFAGSDFINVLKYIGVQGIKDIQREIQAQLSDDDKMQKQSISLSMVLTADRIATDYLFKDGQYISMNESKKLLIDRNELSENERCYQYIMGEVTINYLKFVDSSPTTEKWGMFSEDYKEYVILFSNVLDSICSKGGFSKKSFLSWANREKLLCTDPGKTQKTWRVNRRPTKCYFIRMDTDIPADDNKFIPVPDEIQDKLPFH